MSEEVKRRIDSSGRSLDCNDTLRLILERQLLCMRLAA